MATVLPAPQGPTAQDIRPSRPVSLTAVAVGFCLIEAALWSPRGIQLWIGMLAAAWIIGHTVLSRRPADELGLGHRGLRESLWIPFAALLLGSMLVSAGWLFGSLHGLIGPIPAITHALAYAVWAFQQEFILQGFLFLNLVPVFGARRAILFTALVFSVAHLPNPILTVATFLSGLLLTAAFARYRNVYTIAAAHAILGLALAISLPADMHRNMRVGLGYFTYQPVASSQTLTPAASHSDHLPR